MSFFSRRRPSEKPAKPDDCCPVCGVSFAMYSCGDAARARIINDHIKAFHPAYAAAKGEKEEAGF